MSLSYRKATKEDADLLIAIYNKGFYDDYIHYGECHAYGRTKEGMESSIVKYPKYIVSVNSIPAGVISYLSRRPFDERAKGK